MMERNPEEGVLMEYRRLGKSGMQVSAVGLGTNNFGGRADEDVSLRVIDQALDLDANFIDTANIYTGKRSEEIIGKALKGKRDKAILATKFGMYMGEGPNMIGGSRKHMFDQVEGSLRRLQTDYFDLYQIHAPDRNTPIEETLRALDDLIRQGKVRYIGTSNFAAWHACEAEWAAKSLNVNSFVSEQPHYNILKRGVEKELIPFCRQYGVGIIPYYPLEGGLLTGKYRKGAPPPAGARITGMPEAAQGRYFSDRNFDIIGKLEAFAQERDHTVLELAIAWLLANDTVSSVIAGATKPEQVVANVKAVDWKLTAEEMDELNALAPA
jgi:aryl-alcohol dehydrogenase-like predicted oxidoreductase